MDRLKNFFWLCSGAHIKTLEQCPSEGSKYVGIGATIFFTGIFAFASASYALYTVFDNVWLSLISGLVWGLMIFNLDRYIVSSMRKRRSFSKEFIPAIPRIILALLISLVIAKPLELKVFEKEIEAELALMIEEKHSDNLQQISSNYEQREGLLKTEIEQLKTEINLKTTKRDELMEVARQEADGTGGTLQRNAGPIYRIKKAEADRVEDELMALREKNEQLINEKLAALRKIDDDKAAAITAVEKSVLGGLASRMEALSRLTTKSTAINLANWFIIILFVAIESAPVFVKLISARGPYDDLIKLEEYGFETQRIEGMAATNSKIKARAEKLTKHEKDYVNENLELGLNNT